MKYLRRENLSSKNIEVKIAAYPGSTTKATSVLDYIKPVMRKKPDLRHYFTNGVITINDTRKLNVSES